MTRKSDLKQINQPICLFFHTLIIWYDNDNDMIIKFEKKLDPIKYDKILNKTIDKTIYNLCKNNLREKQRT